MLTLNLPRATSPDPSPPSPDPSQVQSLLPSLRRRTVAQRALRGPVLLLLLATLLLCTGRSALPSPLRWGHAAAAAGWAALLLGTPPPPRPMHPGCNPVCPGCTKAAASCVQVPPRSSSGPSESSSSREVQPAPPSLPWCSLPRRTCRLAQRSALHVLCSARQRALPHGTSPPPYPSPLLPSPPSRCPLRTAGKWLMASALLCVLLPWPLVLGGLGLVPLLLAAHAVMRPRVLG